MRDFLKNVGATVVGMLLVGMIVIALGVMSVIGMVASSSQTKTLPKNSVLVLRLNGTLEEQASDAGMFSSLQGSTTLGMNELLPAIRKAMVNDKIRGIYIEAGQLAAYPSQLQELRAALLDFRKSGKWIIAYGEEYSQGCYYLASVADKVFLNPVGSVDWHGLGGETLYLKDLLAKIGVKAVPIKVGKYKSATEMFTETKMSDADRQQTQRYLDGIWQTMTEGVARSRRLKTDSLNAWADRLISLDDAQVFVKNHMVDQLLYADQVKAAVKRRLNLDEGDLLSQVTPADMVAAPEKVKGEQVAVYYMEGDIVNDASLMGFRNGETFIAARDVVRDLDNLRTDDGVKAVVLRINSGGGDAFASEQIWHAVQLLSKKKPVVVSMSGMAASGAYYLSCGAPYIVAEPNTLTGSIGIFGLLFDTTDLLNNKLNIHFDEVSTNRNATFGAAGKPMTAEQTRLLTKAIQRGYNLFKSRVAQGRHLTMEQVEERAQGHVFLGQDALKLKMVDELGGLDVAVRKAARMARLTDYYTEDYPEAMGFMDQLLNQMTGSTDTVLDEQLQLHLGTLYQPLMMLHRVQAMDRMQMRAPYLMIMN